MSHPRVSPFTGNRGCFRHAERQLKLGAGELNQGLVSLPGDTGGCCGSLGACSNTPRGVFLLAAGVNHHGAREFHLDSSL